MELNAKDIIKGLESCTRGRKSKEDMPCLDCPYNECNIVGGTNERQITGTCQGWLMKDALALIKQLTEENERLKKILETPISVVRVSRGSGKTNHLREVARLRMDAVRAYAVREMQEELHRRFGDDANRVFSNYNIHRYIDQIAKEMLEGNDG